VQWLQSGLASLMGLYQIEFQISLMDLKEVGILIAASSFLCFIASYISVKQYLLKIEPK
jgi:cell division transport system permease protein